MYHSYFRVAVFFILLGMVFSCSQIPGPAPVESENDLTIENGFIPTQPVSVEHGMLVFDNLEDAIITTHQIAVASRAAVDKWEASLGIISQQSLFEQVIRASDSIDNYYWSLPESEQKYWQQQPEIHPDIYYKGLEEGWLKIEKDGEDEYFQYGVIDPGMASIINQEGLVKINGQIQQHSQDAIKTILSGNYDKVALLSRIHESDGDDIVVFRQDAGLTRADIVNDFTRSSSWVYPANKRRYRLWVNGSSAIDDSYCDYAISCTFQIRSEAQKKNFWGNWNYKGDYGYSLSIGDSRGPAAWSYDYKVHNNGGLCGLTNTCIPGPVLPSYSCTGSSSVNCPTSPYTQFYSWTNNGYFSLTPHGSWTTSNYFCEAFDVDYLIYATYNQQWTLTDP